MTLNDDLATRSAPLATAVLTVSQLHEDLRSALEDAGLARVWVSGVVTGLRRGARFTSWELVEYGQDAAQVRAVLSVGVFPRDLARITTVLGGAGLELADGLEVALCGRMDSNPGPEVPLHHPLEREHSVGKLLELLLEGKGPSAERRGDVRR